MEFKQLRALITVADTGNVTKAASLLHIVQPAVSRQLRLLEEDVGVTLFIRGKHGMDLTAEGKILVEYARRVLNDIERARAEVRPTKGSIGGIVNVGLLPSTSAILSSTLVSAVAEAYPGIRIRILVGFVGHLQQWLSNGEIDIALLYGPNLTQAAQAKPILTESFCAVGKPDSKMDFSQPIRFKQLAQQPMILPSQPHGLRSLMDNAAAETGLEFNIIAETNSMAVQKDLVLAGLGITVLPEVAVLDDLKRGLLAAAPLIEPKLVRKVIIAQPVHRQSTAAVSCTLTILEHCIEEKVRSGIWPVVEWLDG